MKVYCEGDSWTFNGRDQCLWCKEMSTIPMNKRRKEWWRNTRGILFGGIPEWGAWYRQKHVRATSSMYRYGLFDSSAALGYTGSSQCNIFVTEREWKFAPHWNIWNTLQHLKPLKQNSMPKSRNHSTLLPSMRLQKEQEDSEYDTTHYSHLQQRTMSRSVIILQY